MRLVLVSNRLPFRVTLEDGRPHFAPSPGGLASGLGSYLERQCANSAGSFEFIWLGWPGATIGQEDRAAVTSYGERHWRARPVFLTESSAAGFYLGFCNRTIWPLFHYRPSLVRYEEEYWEEYVRVNEIFCEAIAEVLQPGDLVWVHDYQLMLLPRLIRERFPEAPIGFFLHIPFPSYEVFRLLPTLWRAGIIEGMLGADLIGFHTDDYTGHFLNCASRTSGYEHHSGRLTLTGRTVRAGTFPMGIEFDKLAAAARTPETENRVAQLRGRCAGQKIIFSVDRLDYTKGIINRLRGYDLFLKTNPKWHGKVVFILSVAPSRMGVESYQAMKQEIEQTVGRIAGAYGTVDWTPLIYQYRELSFNEVVAMYRLCDVALITPLRDGMNLVAKEFVASRPDQSGVLILSETAGAAKELGEAILINPSHYREISLALEQALELPVEEQVRRNGSMQQRLRFCDVNRWADQFIQAAAGRPPLEPGWH